MPWFFHTTCSHCGHHWEGITVGYVIGPEMLADDDWHSLFCPWDYCSVRVPRQIDRNSWDKWFAQFTLTPDYRKSAFLDRACNVIAAALATSPRYTPQAIAAPALPCPHCGRKLEPAESEPQSVVCPRCGQRAAVIDGYDGHVTLS